MAAVLLTIGMSICTFLSTTGKIIDSSGVGLLLDRLMEESNVSSVIYINDDESHMASDVLGYHFERYDVECPDTQNNIQLEQKGQEWSGELVNVIINCHSTERNMLALSNLFIGNRLNVSLNLVVPNYNIIMLTPRLPGIEHILFRGYDASIKLLFITTERDSAWTSLSGNISVVNGEISDDFSAYLYSFSERNRAFYLKASINNVGNTEGSLDVLWKRFTGFGERRFRVGYIEQPLFLMSTIHPVTKEKIFTGILQELLESLSKAFNFTYDLIEEPAGSFGSLNEKGEWTGLVGMLKNQKIDMILTSLTISSHRREVVDFTHAFWEDPVVVVYMEVPKDTGWFYLLQPFSVAVWLVVLSTIIVSGFTMWCFDALIVPSGVGPPFLNRDKKLDGKEFCWNVFGGCLIQAFHAIPVSYSSRLVLTTFWFIVVLVVAAYNGNLKAAMAVPEAKPRIGTLRQLVDDGRFTIAVNKGGANRNILEKSRLGILHDIWEKIDSKESLTKSTSDSLNLAIKDPNAVAIGDQTYVINYMLNSEKKCEWTIIPEPLFTSQFGIALPKNSPFTGIFSQKIMNILEMGLVQGWNKRYFPKSTCKVQQTKQDLIKPIKIDYMRAMSVLVLGGLILSSLSFVIECLSKPTKIFNLIFKWEIN